MSDNPPENHLVKGLKLLGERWTAGPRAWIAAGENLLDTAIRYAMVAAGAYVLWRLVASSWKVLGLAVLVVAIKALRAATKAVKGQGKPAGKTAAATPSESAGGRLPEVSPDRFLVLLHRTLGTAKGVHLRTLAATLAGEYGGAWEIADVRALCGAAGVAVTPTVRAPGGKPTVGVYRVDLPPLPDPSPAPPPAPEVRVVVAGQNATTTPTTPATTAVSTTPTTPTERRVGDLRIVSQDDPRNPARTHVTVTSHPAKT